MFLKLIIKLKLRLYSRLYGFDAGKDLLIMELEAHLNECCSEYLSKNNTE